MLHPADTLRVPRSTPWGQADHVETLWADRIARVDTPSHGGYYVAQGTVRQQIPKPWRDYAESWTGSAGWFEEDCAWAAVALTFPALFHPEAVLNARETARRYLPCPVCGEPAGDGALNRTQGPTPDRCSRGHVVDVHPADRSQQP